MWDWILILFFVSIIIGTFSVISGIEIGLLFIPVILAFFPFHFDFIKTCGLIIGLTGSLAASPGFLKENLSNLKITFPIAFIMSISSILGAIIGIILPEKVLYIGLAILIFFVCIFYIIVRLKLSEFPCVKRPDYLSRLLHLSGIMEDNTTGRLLEWKAHRVPISFMAFIIIAMLTGMFGITTGWASIPILNLLMGLPLRISVATSKFLITITHSTALWIFINQGSIIPLIIVPSLVGTMLGASIGIRILDYFNHTIVRRITIITLVFIGIKIFMKA